MPYADIFQSDAYSMVSLTKGVNVIPVKHGMTSKLALFTPKPISTTVVAIEEKSGTLNIVPATERGLAGTPSKRGKRSMRYFGVDRRRLEDHLKASDLQNVRQFGSETELDTVASKTVEIMEQLRGQLDQTREFLRMGALSGHPIDADGSTMFNFFDEFGVTQKTVNFDLATSSTNISAKADEAKRHIRMNSGDQIASGFVVLCSPEFYDAFIDHGKVRDVYLRLLESGSNNSKNPLLSGDSTADFANITWISYDGVVTYIDVDGGKTERKFIPAGEAIMAPLGTDNFEEYLAPADTLETANTMGQEFYSWMEENGKTSTKLLVETNALPIVKNPRVIVKLTSS